MQLALHLHEACESSQCGLIVAANVIVYTSLSSCDPVPNVIATTTSQDTPHFYTSQDTPHHSSTPSVPHGEFPVMTATYQGISLLL